MFIVVGVTGGIAAYKTVHVVRALVTAGHEVHVIPTDDALRFVGTTTWEAVSRNPVTTSVHSDVAEVRHVALGTQADLVIIAPATANTLAKMTAGLAGDLLGVTLLATTAPVVVAPAMHTAMWEHTATQANIATLRARGVHIIGPASGPLTGGDSGPGRMVEPDDIVAQALAIVSGEGDLTGLTVAVSTGGTREPIDPVRFLGNRSSGTQGTEVALAAAARGAAVRLVAAHVDEGVLNAASRHPGIHITRVSSAADLEAAMTDAAAGADVVVMAAAVGDFRAETITDDKLRKEDGDGTWTLTFTTNPDILAGLVESRNPGQTVVGFAAETAADDDELLDRGRRKRARKGVDLLAVNQVSWDQGFGAGGNRLLVIDDTDDVVSEASGSKRETADALWDTVLARRAR